MKETQTKQKILDTALNLIWENSYGSVSVDDICKKAEVLKGSFYHFFPSKSELAAAAYDHQMEMSKLDWDRIFSREVPPLVRMTRLADHVYKSQRKKTASVHKVLGCPFTSLGAEMSTLDKLVQKKVEENSRSNVRYFTQAIQDAQKAGLIPKRNPSKTAESLQCFLMGVLVQARIENNIEIIRMLKPGFLNLLGAGAGEEAGIK